MAPRVIVGITEQPLKAIIYSLGFVGGLCRFHDRERLAFGKVIIQVITGAEMGKKIAATLREHVGVTTLPARAKTRKTILMVFASRRNKN